jgi:hypothetical protein
MRLASSKNIRDCFDQPQIDGLEQALKRAWEIVQQMDITGPPREGYVLLADCIMDEARSGEESQVVLINRAILRFRLRQARIASQKRRA